MKWHVKWTKLRWMIKIHLFLEIQSTWIHFVKNIQIAFWLDENSKIAYCIWRVDCDFHLNWLNSELAIASGMTSEIHMVVNIPQIDYRASTRLRTIVVSFSKYASTPARSRSSYSSALLGCYFGIVALPLRVTYTLSSPPFNQHVYQCLACKPGQPFAWDCVGPEGTNNMAETDWEHRFVGMIFR